MGKLEQESKKRARKENIQKLALSTIKIAGLLSVGLLAPNMLGALTKLGIIDNRNYRLNRSIDRLKRGGLIKFEKTSKGLFVRLTPDGERKLYSFYKNSEFLKPKKWDGKWRIIIFDIKERQRRTRDLLRLTIQNIGFRKLQQSVWVYPYDCEDFVTLMKADFKMGKTVLYIIADKIEYDKPLREMFDLPAGK